MKWAGETVAQTPFTVQVCDPSNVTVSGPALSSGKAKVFETIELAVHAENAGKADLDIKPTNPSGDVYITDIVLSYQELPTETQIEPFGAIAIEAQSLPPDIISAMEESNASASTGEVAVAA